MVAICDISEYRVCVKEFKVCTHMELSLIWASKGWRKPTRSLCGTPCPNHRFQFLDKKLEILKNIEGRCRGRRGGREGREGREGDKRLGYLWTPRKYAILPCGLLDFESAVTFDISYSRSLNVKTWPRNSILSLDTFKYFLWISLSRHKWCTRKMELALEVKFYLDFHWVTRSWRPPG